MHICIIFCTAPLWFHLELAGEEISQSLTPDAMLLPNKTLSITLLALCIILNPIMPINANLLPLQNPLLHTEQSCFSNPQLLHQVHKFPFHWGAPQWDQCSRQEQEFRSWDCSPCIQQRATHTALGTIKEIIFPRKSLEVHLPRPHVLLEYNGGSSLWWWLSLLFSLHPFRNLPMDFGFWLTHWSKNQGLGAAAREGGYQTGIDQFSCPSTFQLQCFCAQQQGQNGVRGQEGRGGSTGNTNCSRRKSRGQEGEQNNSKRPLRTPAGKNCTEDKRSSRAMRGCSEEGEQTEMESTEMKNQQSCKEAQQLCIVQHISPAAGMGLSSWQTARAPAELLQSTGHSEHAWKQSTALGHGK